MGGNELFLARAEEKFGDRFDLSGVDYVNNKTKVGIACSVHGYFSIRPQQFISSPCGCPRCGQERGGKRRMMSLDTFLTKAKDVHGDAYDYSKVDFVDKDTEVCIVCPKHGDFWQKPHNHLKGYGCKECGREKLSVGQSKGIGAFIDEAMSVHGDAYDYSKVEYVNANDKVCIICPKHGEFWQEPHNHLRGCGCPYCANKFKTTDDFVKSATLIHGGRYSYEKVVYLGATEKVCIVCPKHGEFWQTPLNHLQSHGCPHCGFLVSRWEREVYDFVCCLGVECFQSDRRALGGMELDIFIPSLRVGIECDGLRWHSDLYKAKDYHIKKSEECILRGIRPIHIFEDEWKYKRPIVESVLRNVLGKTERKLYARKCEIRLVASKEKAVFLDNNHIQGNAKSSVSVGLSYNGELVYIMSFAKRGTSYELIRFCNKIRTVVVGGASKLFKWFLKTYEPKRIASYSDKRWSLGEIYPLLGFVHVNDSEPNYFYVDGFTRIKKERLVGNDNRLPRIYDCGMMVLEWFPSV